VPYAADDARQQLLDVIAQACERLAVALAELSEAYEGLDTHSADRMEEQLFAPVQASYGRLRRAHAQFAQRHDLPARAFESAQAGPPSKGVKGFLEAAASAVAEADWLLSTLQDSMLPVEVGDAELRADLEQVRSLLGNVSSRARELTRAFGR
jgi:hypothetical protein